MWKEKLYSYLIQRVLGPILSKKSSAKLYENIQATGNTFVFFDLELDSNYVTNEFLSPLLSPFVQLRSCSVQKLQITLSFGNLPQEGDEDEASSQQSSTFWNILTANTSSLYVQAHLDFTGLYVELALLASSPGNESNIDLDSIKTTTIEEKDLFANINTTHTQNNKDDDGTTNFWMSCVNAVLASLRVHVEHLTLVLVTDNTDSKLIFNLSSATYYDIKGIPQTKQQFLSHTKDEVSSSTAVRMHKVIDFSEFTIQLEALTHDNNNNNTHNTAKILEAHGCGQFKLRVFQQGGNNKNDNNSIYHDISITLHQQWTLPLTILQVCILLPILDSIVYCTTQQSKNTAAIQQTTADQSIVPNDSATVGANFATNNHFMDQVYSEARTLAQTKQVIGGILVPSFNEELDAFFDCTDRSFSVYLSLVRPAESTVTGRIHVHLTELVVTILMSETNTNLSLTMGDISISGNTSDMESSFVIELIHMELESSITDSNGSTTTTNIMKFLEEVESNRMMVTMPPCITWNYRKTKLAKNGPTTNWSPNDAPIETSHEITFLPIQISIPTMQFIDDIRTHVVSFTTSPTAERFNTCPDSIAVTVPGSRELLKCHFPSILCYLPISLSQNQTESLISRGIALHYLDDGINSSAVIGLEFKSFQLDIKNFTKLRPDISNNYQLFKDTLVAFESASFFARCTTTVENERRITRRMDFLKLSSDTETDQTIECKYNCRGEDNNGASQENYASHHLFPYCYPISLAKAPQEILSVPHTSTSSDDGRHGGSRIATDMLERAKRCGDILQVSVPLLVVDVAVHERILLLEILSGILQSSASFEVQRKQPRSDDSKTSPLIGISITCHRSVLLLLEDNATINSSSTTSTRVGLFVIVADSIKVHTVITSGIGMMQCRLLVHDFALYEAHRYARRPDGHPPKLIKGLGVPFNVQETNAVLFRSKIGKPLSSQTPCIHIDFTTIMSDKEKKQDASIVESDLYINFYEITHRLDIIDSQWLHNFLEVICIEGSKKIDSSVLEEKTADSVTKLFLTCTDCNLDYTSPILFNRAARAVGRIGEIHLSCNIVSGSLSQSYKVALADVSFFLTNRRCSRTRENTQLLYSRQVHVDNEVITEKGSKHLMHQYSDRHKLCAFEDVLGSMGFVSMISLDSADIFVKILDDNTPRSQKKMSVVASMPIAKFTLDLTLGQMNLYACRDSFECLTDMVGDISLYFTNISGGEQFESAAVCTSSVISNGDSKLFPDYTSNNAKALSVSSVADICDDELLHKIPDSELSAKELRRKHNITDDNDLAIKVARALLIKNYYTVDTKPIGINNGVPEEDQVTNNPRAASFNSLTVNDIADALHDGLLLDGYDWTDVDYCGWSRIPAETGQQSEWLASSEIHIFPNHVAVDPVRDPLAEGDMNAAQLVGSKESPCVELRVFIRELSANFRFFTGFDWDTRPLYEPLNFKQTTPGTKKRKEQLLGTLLEKREVEDDDLFLDRSNTRFSPRITRQLDKYFEVSLSGARMRLDVYSQSLNHRLASTLDLKIMDVFFSESLSSEVPVKFLFEWVNDKKHPRDADDGMVMMKMISFHPICNRSADGRLKGDECRVTLQLLPLRCHLDQNVLRVIQDFFSSESRGSERYTPAEVTDSSSPPPSNNSIESFFESVQVKPCKLKLNYRPTGVDAAALREGSYVELLNLFSLENVELTLKSIELKALFGWGSVFSEIFRRYVEDICNTQLHKFLAGAAPLQPISNLGGGVADLVLIPMLHYKKDRNLSKGIRKATTHFASTVTLEALNTTSKITRSVARTLSKASPQKRPLSLPARPEKVPRSIGDTAQHAYDSISRGLKASNYMIVVVPRQEYKKSGATGAVKSVVKGIPIALLAPISGASEALSYTLVGIRNQLHPNIRKEEEVRQSGLRR